MKKLVLIMIICSVGLTNAAITTFDFDALPAMSSAGAISTYMSGVFGNTVTATDIKSNTNATPTLDWIGNATTWVTNTRNDGLPSDFEILFSTPITGFSFDGYILDAGVGSDFRVFAYDNTYGSVENPNIGAQVYFNECNILSPLRRNKNKTKTKKNRMFTVSWLRLGSKACGTERHEEIFIWKWRMDR